MNFRLCTGLAAIVCMSLASCYPYNENKSNKKPTKGHETTAPTPDQLKLKEQEEAKKKAADELKAKEQAATANTTEKTGPVTPPSTPTKSSEPKRNDYAVANKVPSKEGFVFSPYNNKVVDVRDIPSGTLVQDPTYPASEKKYFRVP
jgi:hypothetical protein